MKQKGETQLGNVAKFYKMGTTCIDAVFNLTEVVCVCVGGRAGQVQSALDLYLDLMSASNFSL